MLLFIAIIAYCYGVVDIQDSAEARKLNEISDNFYEHRTQIGPEKFIETPRAVDESDQLEKLVGRNSYSSIIENKKKRSIQIPGNQFTDSQLKTLFGKSIQPIKFEELTGCEDANHELVTLFGSCKSFVKFNESLSVSKVIDPELKNLFFPKKHIDETQIQKPNMEKDSYVLFDTSVSKASSFHDKEWPVVFFPLENLQTSNLHKVAAQACLKLQYHQDFKFLSDVLAQLLNDLIREVEQALSSERSFKNTSTLCDCTRAERKIIVVYESPNNLGKALGRFVVKIAHIAQDFLLQHGSVYFYKKNFHMENLESQCELTDLEQFNAFADKATEKMLSNFLKVLRKLQRDLVLSIFYLRISKFANKLFDLSESSAGTQSKHEDFGPHRSCRGSFFQSAKHDALIKTVYLRFLHMEIIELPEFADRNLIADTLSSINTVSLVENDISFTWDEFPVADDNKVANVKHLVNNSHIARGIRALRSKYQSKKTPGNLISKRSFHPDLNNSPRNEYNRYNTYGHLRMKRTTERPNDPFFNLQWALSKDFPASVNLIDAWPNNHKLKDIEPVTVAVIDSGLDLNHREFRDQVWINKDEIPNNGIDDDNNEYVDDINGWNFPENLPQIQDLYGHGTKVSGIIAAITNNRIGIASFCSFCKIMVLKVTCQHFSDRHLSSSSFVIMAINYALGKKIKIVNYSMLGKSSLAFQICIARAGLSNMLIAACAGNKGNNLDLSENWIHAATFGLKNVVSVAAIDKKGKLVRTSSYGHHTVTLGAPGKSIYTTCLNNDYVYASGTSLAAPHVAGLVAFLYGLYPELNYRHIIQKLIDGGNMLPGLQGKTKTGKAVNFYNIFRKWHESSPEERLQWDRVGEE